MSQLCCFLCSSSYIQSFLYLVPLRVAAKRPDRQLYVPKSRNQASSKSPSKPESHPGSSPNKLVGNKSKISSKKKSENKNNLTPVSIKTEAIRKLSFPEVASCIRKSKVLDPQVDIPKDLTAPSVDAELVSDAVLVEDKEELPSDEQLKPVSLESVLEVSSSLPATKQDDRQQEEDEQVPTRKANEPASDEQLNADGRLVIYQ